MPPAQPSGEHTFRRGRLTGMPAAEGPAVAPRAPVGTTAAPLAGIAAVCWLVATTRWGSHIGVPPFYVTDLLVALALVVLGVRLTRHPVPAPWPRLALVLLLLAWVVIRLVWSWPWTVTTARDAAPYLYAVLGVASAWSMQLTDARGRARTARWLLTALQIHAVWWLTVSYLPQVRSPMPTVDGLQVLSVRSDMDTALAGLYAAWLLSGVLRRDRTVLRLLGLAVLWSAIVQSPSRAGFLAAVVASVFVLIGAEVRRARWSRRRLLAQAVIAGAAFLLIVLVTPVGDRLLGTVGLDQSSEGGVHARGTTNARAMTWTRLTNYQVEDPVRAVVGVGFGPDFMADSEAARTLLGSVWDDPLLTDLPFQQSTRSPHNYWLGSWARLGVVGLALLLCLGFVTTVRLARTWRQPGDDLVHLSALMVVSLVVPATLGVILESPFGAIPFWWCVGVLAASGVDSDRVVLSRFRMPLILVLAGSVLLLGTVSRNDVAVPTAPFPDPPAGPQLAQLQGELTSALAATSWPAGLAIGPTPEGAVDTLHREVSACQSQPWQLANCQWGDPEAAQSVVVIGEPSSMLDVAALTAALTTDRDWRVISMLGDDCGLELPDGPNAATSSESCRDRSAEIIDLVPRLRPTVLLITGLDGNREKTRQAATLVYTHLKYADLTLWLPGPPPVQAAPCSPAVDVPQDCIATALPGWRPPEVVMATALDHWVVDPTSWFCVARACPAWAAEEWTREGGQVTGPYAQRLGPVIAEAIVSLVLEPYPPSVNADRVSAAR